MNLGLEVMPELQLRFAAARQAMRPPMGEMRGGMSVGICDNCSSQPIWSANGGNPALRPWLANAYDLSLEKYFSTDAGNRGYLGLAYFYKDLVSYVWNQTVPFDFAGLPLPPAVAGQTNYRVRPSVRFRSRPMARTVRSRARKSVCRFRWISCGRRSMAWGSWPAIRIPAAASV
ncbi:MAG: TonB-dependent receptor [Thermomonas sp.]|nr:TonB-dependent receptor [Thermomonas sp.]